MRKPSNRLTALVLAAAVLCGAAFAGPVLAKDTVVIYTAIENEQITEYKKA